MKTTSDTHQPNCCCEYGCAVSGEYPEFSRPCCEIHTGNLMRGTTPCRRHRDLPCDRCKHPYSQHHELSPRFAIHPCRQGTASVRPCDCHDYTPTEADGAGQIVGTAVTEERTDCNPAPSPKQPRGGDRE